MKNHQEPELDSSQQSVYYPINLIDQTDAVLGTRPDFYSHGYTHMLIEDVCLRIMPAGSHTARKSFGIVLNPPDPRTQKLIADALSQNGHRQNLTTAMCDFFHYCAKSIMGFEKAVCEIVYLSKPDDGTVVGFKLKQILPFTVMHRRTRLVQYVPLVVARERNIPQYVPLSPKRILTFRLPAYIQEEFGYIMESLSWLNDFTPPDFALQEPGITSKRILYDFNSHFHTHKLALADATKLIGWNARNLLSEGEVLQYYQLHRDLLFERFVIELRNSILITLNDGLERAGKMAGFSGQLEIKGLPTLVDVDAAKAHLEAGDQSFGQILDPFGLL